MSDCPYRSLPDSAYWKRGISDPAMANVDPIVQAPFAITKTDRIATAGSCFAQHVARYLGKSGYNYFVAEKAPALIDAAVARRFGYGVFSCRYGNIYTVRQLNQLFDRAYGLFHPVEDCWKERYGVLDPYRPNVQPAPFASEREMRTDREHHFAATRRMFEECDIFVFTLGLTETWINREDGAVFPICPGCGGGDFDDNKHQFVNFDVADVEADLAAFIKRFISVNAAARIILTVSPVPLIATMSGQHVLAATTYSKSVLRVAAETTARKHPNVTYFPSFEVITGSYNRGLYFMDDLRNVTEAGVAHVMGLFFKHFANDQRLATTIMDSQPAPDPLPPASVAIALTGDGVDDLICDEIILTQRSLALKKVERAH